MQLDGLRDLIKQHEGGSFKKIGWFSLKDDGDEKIVRILAEGITDEGKVDLPIYELHKVETLGRFGRNVLCKGEECSLCRTGHRKQLRMLLPLYVEGDESEIQIWDRGIVDIKKLLSMHQEYGKLNKRDFKIKRNGARGSTNTTYEYFPRDPEEKELPTLEEKEVVNKTSFFLLDLTEDLMELAAEGRLTEDLLKEGGNPEPTEMLEGFNPVDNEDVPF